MLEKLSPELAPLREFGEVTKIHPERGHGRFPEFGLRITGIKRRQIEALLVGSAHPLLRSATKAYGFVHFVSEEPVDLLQLKASEDQEILEQDKSKIQNAQSIYDLLYWQMLHRDYGSLNPVHTLNLPMGVAASDHSPPTLLAESGDIRTSYSRYMPMVQLAPLFHPANRENLTDAFSKLGIDLEEFLVTCRKVQAIMMYPDHLADFIDKNGFEFDAFLYCLSSIGKFMPPFIIQEFGLVRLVEAVRGANSARTHRVEWRDKPPHESWTVAWDGKQLYHGMGAAKHFLDVRKGLERVIIRNLTPAELRQRK